MIQKILKTVLVCFVLANTFIVNACTIFMANDGQNVWIGNNEDELQNVKYRMWFFPAKSNNYGYSIWTELSFGKLLNGFSYLNPQGGLNEFGLFMDFTAIDKISLLKDDQKKDRKKQVVTDILKKCKTVDEALTFINKYNLVKLLNAQLFIGDASGNYATVTGGYIVGKTDNSFALTNYCINNGHKEACHRRDAATHYLNSSTTFQLNDITNILEKSTQKLPNNLISNYSMAVNLKTSTIYLYYKNDFATVSTLILSEELKKGKHHKDIQDYFPESITNILETEYKNNGINSAIEQYKTLRKTSYDKYNFKNDDAINLAISWTEKGQTNDAIKLLECLKEFDPGNTNIYSWLGVANRKVSNVEESNKYFSKVLEQKPNDYLATLWGKQENQKVIFKLADFEDAQQVSVMGDFSEWTKHPVKMKKENSYWTCEVSLPKGENIYKFIVNDQYLADSKNYMHIGTGPKIYSKLYVW
jgi:Glycogen recognition site of AMP-activated protein kinase